MLSAAKHLCAHPDRPFAALRVTNYYRSWLLMFIIAPWSGDAGCLPNYRGAILATFSPYYSPGNLLIQPAQVRQVLQTIVPAWLRFLCQKLVIFVSPGKPHEVIMEFCLHLGNHT